MTTGQDKNNMPKKQEVPTEMLKHSATVLVNARTSAGISQREVSKRINVTQPLISSWEQGKALPTVNHIVSIEKALGIESGAVLMAVAYGLEQMKD